MTIGMRPSCWHQSFGTNELSVLAQGLCLNFFSSISSALRWAIQDQWSSGYFFVLLSSRLPFPPDLMHNKSLLRSGIKLIQCINWKLKILKNPMKHYSNILWYPIENVKTQFTKKVVHTYPVTSNPYMDLCCFSSGHLPFSGPYVLKDEQN